MLHHRALMGIRSPLEQLESVPIVARSVTSRPIRSMTPPITPPVSSPSPSPFDGWGSFHRAKSKRKPRLQILMEKCDREAAKNAELKARQDRIVARQKEKVEKAAKKQEELEHRKAEAKRIQEERAAQKKLKEELQRQAREQKARAQQVERDRRELKRIRRERAMPRWRSGTGWR